MRYSLKADEFNLEYKESKIFPSVIRERHCHAQFEMIAVLDGDVAVMIAAGIGYTWAANVIQWGEC